MQNYTDNSHGDVPLTVEIACYFQFSFNWRCAHALMRRKIKIIVFHIKDIFIEFPVSKLVSVLKTFY